MSAALKARTARVAATAKRMRSVASSDDMALAAAVTLIGATAAAADPTFRADVTSLLRSLADELERPPTEAFKRTNH